MELIAFLWYLVACRNGSIMFRHCDGGVSTDYRREKAAVASGIVQASAGIGDAIMSPLLQQLTDSFGVTLSMPVFSIPILLMLPIVFWLGGKEKN